jgi:hypothetical protein
MRSRPALFTLLLLIGDDEAGAVDAVVRGTPRIRVGDHEWQPGRAPERAPRSVSFLIDSRY